MLINPVDIRRISLIFDIFSLKMRTFSINTKIGDIEANIITMCTWFVEFNAISKRIIPIPLTSPDNTANVIPLFTFSFLSSDSIICLLNMWKMIMLIMSNPNEYNVNDMNWSTTIPLSLKNSIARRSNIADIPYKNAVSTAHRTAI